MTPSCDPGIALCDSLADIRSAIDQIDFMLVGLLAERGRYVREAARFKRDKAEVAAPARVQQVVANALRHAGQMGASPQVVEAVYRSMIEAFIELESRQHDALAGVLPSDTGTMSGCMAA